MEFREARSLAVLAKTESLAKTAKFVNLTPAAVHKQLKNLESELGVTLYEKTGRTIHLTQAATVLLPHLEEFLSTYDAINAVITDWKGLRSGFIRIGVNPAASTVLLPSLLRKYRELWPKVTVMLDVDTGVNLSNRVGNRSLDLALGIWDDAGRTPVVSRMTWQYPIVPVASPELKIECKQIRELSSYTLVRIPQGILASWVDTYLKSHKFRAGEVLVVNNSHTMNAMICAGLGFGFMPKWAVDPELKAGKLQVLPCKERLLLGTVDLISVKYGHLSPAVQAFIDLARGFSWPHLELLS